MAEPEFLDVEPTEAVEYFRAKGRHIGFDWRDTDAATHMASFTVAKAASLDILRDIRDALDSAVANGDAFETFYERLEPVLREKGWWGKREMVDPRTGETRTVQLGSPRRLKTIFRTNLATAYARGLWQSIERDKEDLPYLRYVAVLDDRVRHDHRFWHGTVLPVDDPWWRTHYPPNGWGCRCTVQQYDAETLARYGYEVLPTRPAYEGQTRAWHNERTGEDVRVPFGIDPGWDHNVGLRDSVDAARSILVSKAADAPVAVAQAALEDGWDSYAANGRAVMQTIANSVRGKVGDRDHAARFRKSLIATVERERGAGEVVANVVPALEGKGHELAAETVRRVSRLFPRRWVERANEIPLRVASNGQGGRGGGAYYNPWIDGTVKNGKAAVHKTGKGDGDPVAFVPASDGVAFHEYTHHIQYLVGGLDDIFQAAHKARTRRHKLLPLSDYPGNKGRKDKYIDQYFGREYENVSALGPAREVITMAYETIFFRTHDKDRLHDLLKDDPGLVALAIGALLRYDPQVRPWES